MTDQPSKEAVEALARKRWNARRAEICGSGTAADPGREWDEIEPNPQNGHDVRAAEFNRAERDLGDIEPILRPRIEAELRERLLGPAGREALARHQYGRHKSRSGKSVAEVDALWEGVERNVKHRFCMDARLALKLTLDHALPLQEGRD